MARNAYLQEIEAAFAQFVAPPVPVDQGSDVPLWEPLPGPQTLAYESLADELYFGGAAGGGKSMMLLGLALTRHQNSVIFRREFAQFRGADGLIERSKEIVGARGRMNEGTSTWRNLPGGRALEFGGVQNEKDVSKWRGRAHDFYGFDEIPEFTLMQYRVLTGWLRTTLIGQRTRVVCAGNPPSTPEGMWVIQYWAPWLDKTHPRPALPGELRWYATVGGKDVERPDGEPFEMEAGPERDRLATLKLSTLVRPRSRSFIPAFVEDNPYYMRTGYVDVLNNLPEPWRSQLRFGNFLATQSDDSKQVIPTAWVKAAQARWTPDGANNRPMTAAGVDCSRGGQDEFVISPRHDEWFAPQIIRPASAAPDGAAGAQLVWDAVDGDTGVVVNLDAGGPGVAVLDYVRDLGLEVVALNGSERDPDARASSTDDKIGFVNKRAEWHWRLREALDPLSGQDLAIPPDPQLAADLCAPRWRITPRGIQIEEKETIKKRIGRSPDRGEALIYAAADEGGPSLAAGARFPLYR